VVSDPVINSTHIEPSWAGTCFGSYAPAPKSFAPDLAAVATSHVLGRLVGVGRPSAVNGEQLCDERQSVLNRRSQVEQGRSVLTGTADPIALMAHKPATQRGMSGPYPWRPPV
jgi:hypothetical protein